MRITLAAVCFIFSVGIAGAQVPASDNPANSVTPANPANPAATTNPDKLGDSTGRTIVPETKGQLQPQGWTGPIETTSGGAPAGSPQGQSPPGMQAAPEGSSKTVVEPAKK